jgi:CubicO group peptidase (beta-lactamase class C family)
VGRGGKIAFAKGFGVADLASKHALGPEAVMDIGSVAKQFTAAAVLKLVDEARLDLDAPVTRYLPLWRDGGRGISVRQLLNHTSGLEDPPFSEDKPESRFLNPVSSEGLLAQSQTASFRFAPQETWYYSNTGYLLLGLILEQLHKKPYAAVIDEVIAKPLGLSTLVYCDKNRPIANRARDYVLDNGKPMAIPPIDVSWFGGAGALCATASDLVRWEHALWSGRLLSQASRTSMHSPSSIQTSGTSLQVDYGFARAFGVLGGHRKIAHTGYGAGITAILTHYPDDDLILAVLTNTNGQGATDARAIEARLAATLLGVKSSTSNTEAAVTPIQVANWSGTYLGSFGPIRLRLARCEGGGMCTTRLGDPSKPRRLTHQGEGLFVNPREPNGQIRAVPSHGQAQWIVETRHGVHDNVYRRTESQ